MANENNTNKDVANSLSSVSDYSGKGINVILDSANQINNWYAEQINKISEADIPSNRLETNVDNSINEAKEQTSNKIETKVTNYSELQTNKKQNQKNIQNNSRIKTQNSVIENEIEGQAETVDENSPNTLDNENSEGMLENEEKLQNNKIPDRIATAIKGLKIINTSTTKAIKTGKTISIGLNTNTLKSFEASSTKLNNKAIKKVGNKLTKNARKKMVTGTTNMLVKTTKVLAKIMANLSKMIISMLPSIAPAIIIIIIIIVCFCSFFGLGMNDDTMKKYEEYMISTQNAFNDKTIEAYNNGQIVEGTIEGKGMINWRASMSIIQMLNGELNYDDAEKNLLKEFEKANLYEQIKEEKYTYEKTTTETDSDGNTKTKTETITETKLVVVNPSLDDYINWCNSNFDKINKYKKKKKIAYDENQTSFTENEIEQIKLLYGSNSFFDLFSDDFKSTYAYSYISIRDEQLQAIYDEFLKNVGTRYLMDHSNLKYDECMDYYDCSSWVIHVLGHTGIKIIPNTGAQGIYKYHCYPIDVNDRQAGDMIFLKDTYDTGEPGSISHIGIYMGELTINGETAEWVIDTGGNPSGVRIRKYKNGWWNGPNFYGFARLKE